MSLTKNGVWTAKTFCNPKAMNCYYNEYPGDWGNSFTFRPGTANNSSTNIHFAHIDEVGLYHIKLNVVWSGFDESNENGTFDIFFQGDVLNAGIWTWAYNSMAVSLNSQQALRDLVLGSNSGSYSYDTTFSVSATDVTAMRLGIRSNYSNGVGNITVSDVEVVHDRYYTQGNNIKISDNYIVANNFIEM